MQTDSTEPSAARVRGSGTPKNSYSGEKTERFVWTKNSQEGEQTERLAQPKKTQQAQQLQRGKTQPEQKPPRGATRERVSGQTRPTKRKRTPFGERLREEQGM
jgi:hypothetical protein